jgi:VanZ family protein
MSDKRVHFVKYYLPAILWAALLFVLSSIPSSSLPSIAIKIKDLLLHFAAYTVFGVFLSLAIIQTPGNASGKLLFLVFIIGMAYGASDELHQKFVAGRTCTLHDFLADCAGVLFGMVLFMLIPPALKSLQALINQIPD